MPNKVYHRTKLKKIELIDTLLENASEIAADMKLEKICRITSKKRAFINVISEAGQ
jgi:hypothetical protein